VGSIKKRFVKLG